MTHHIQCITLHLEVSSNSKNSRYFLLSIIVLVFLDDEFYDLPCGGNLIIYASHTSPFLLTKVLNMVMEDVETMNDAKVHLLMG